MNERELFALVKRVDPLAVRLPPGIKTIADEIIRVERERLVAEAQRVKDMIATKYQERIDTGTSDMTSNSDWMRLEGAVRVVEAIRRLE